MKKENNIHGKISLKTKLLFGAGDIFGGGAFNIINFFFALFLTDVIGLNMVYVSPVFLIGKIWDAVTDPFMGTITDGTKSKLGRRRPYFLAGIILIFISFFILWYPVDFDTQTGKFIFVLFAYLFFNTVVTMVMVPYQAMSAEISLDYNERTSVNSIRLAFSLGSSLICAVIPMLIVNSFADIRTGYIVMAAVFGLLFSLPWFGVFFSTKEREDFKPQKRTVNFKAMFIDPFKIKSFRYLLLMFLAAYLSMDIVSMIFAYYMKYYVLEPAALSMVLGVLLIVEILFIPFYAFIAKKKSKTFAFIIGAVIWALGSLLIFLVPQGAPLYLVIILAALIGSGVSAAAVIPHTLFGDVTDVGELAYSERREGSFSGIITFARKFASGIAVAFVTFLLGITGYLNPEIILENGVEKSVERIQPESVLLTIRIIIAFVPLVLMALGIWAALKYPLNPDNHRKMIDYLTARRKGEKLEGISQDEIDKLKEELI